MNGLMEKCNGYLWLMGHDTHYFSYGGICDRIQCPTVVHEGYHSWLQPNVQVSDFEHLFEEIVTLIHDAYVDQEMNLGYPPTLHCGF